jgi:hypothetical protein
MFLNSLPDCTRMQDTLARLPGAVKRWLRLVPSQHGSPDL